MIPTQIQIDLDQEEVRNYIQEQIDKELNNQLLFIDIDGLSHKTSFSRRFLEDNFLRDPRMKCLERRKGSHSKRVWYAEQAFNAIQEIIEEW